MTYTNGICLRNCKISGFPDYDSIKDLPEGTLVEFIVTQGENQVIRVFTYDNRTIKREKPLYITTGENLQLIDKELWPFLIAIYDAEDRLKCAKNHELMDFVAKKIKVNDEVFIKTETTGDDYVRGIVKYIALVPELGSGYYFGVEIPELIFAIPNKSLTGESIRLTVVVSVQMIKPSPNDSTINDLQEEPNCKTSEDVATALTNLNCEESKPSDEPDEAEDEETVQLIESLLKEGVAMKCPECGIIIEKDDGCDLVTCTVCTTEICWATKGLRWGPGGSGDTSGGCGCTPEKRCAPSCENCH